MSMNSMFDRRGFLKVGAAGLLGSSLPDLLRAEARSDSARRPKATAAILVWLSGGPATIDMWDLKPDAPEEIRGEFKSIASKAPGVRICEHLPRIAAVMDRCALIRSLHHSITDHAAGSAYIATGHPPSAALRHPSLGAVAAKLLPEGRVPPYFNLDGAAGFPGDAGFLGSPYNPFKTEVGVPGAARTEGISLPTGFTSELLVDRDRLRETFDTRFQTTDETDLPAGLDRFQKQAVEILRSDRIRRAFDVSAEKETVRESYGKTPFAVCALTARRLIEAGARFVTIGLGGWDTHRRSFGALRQQLLPELDRVLAALITDLQDRALLDKTVVYCTGEFGRTPRINGDAGRDHWSRSMAVFLAGGGVKTGCVYGSTDTYGMGPDENPCSPADVSATVLHLLGIEPTQEIHTPSGRPIALFRDGKILEALVDS